MILIWSSINNTPSCLVLNWKHSCTKVTFWVSSCFWRAAVCSEHWLCIRRIWTPDCAHKSFQDLYSCVATSDSDCTYVLGSWNMRERILQNQEASSTVATVSRVARFFIAFLICWRISKSVAVNKWCVWHCVKWRGKHTKVKFNFRNKCLRPTYLSYLDIYGFGSVFVYTTVPTSYVTCICSIFKVNQVPT